ncbi:serine aminopeptidase S33 family [Krasilnikovia cinnamomea]|uniref:Serine aminopeptidase S33 family n=1 Tax=Krasilnikovia cinnamomea TaxID=349313 RepID=A0A4Q7ZQ80_9ACTN|nr:alpha/beta fold hydrolase [Krasilnikovia cinnamomea]RZU52891.1 serine aminopeptidase S33 family [Krasilnikovia cinnamomea]
MRSDLLRFADWSSPVRPVARELSSALPDGDEGRPPLLFVPGLGHGPWAFTEHWLGHAARRGFPAHAVGLRERGDLRAYAHDVVQTAASLPRQAVLIGHGAGALVVSRALARYPARAGVLVAPVLDGWAGLGAALRANPLGTLPAIVGGALRLSRRQLFSPELPVEQADAYRGRLVPAGARAQWQLLAHRAAPRPVGSPPVLVVGSPDDRVVPRAALDRTAARFGAAPLLFPGMGHDLMLDAGWAEPIDAILDWLGKELPPTTP